MERQIDVDVMTMHGEHYYGRMKAKIHAKPVVDECGRLKWIIGHGELMDAVVSQFPTLKGRKDIVLYSNEKNHKAKFAV